MFKHWLLFTYWRGSNKRHSLAQVWQGPRSRPYYSWWCWRHLWLRLRMPWRHATRIWQDEELADDWSKGLLITGSKKGNLNQCSNWRGHILLSIPSKVLCKLIGSAFEGRWLSNSQRVNRIPPEPIHCTVQTRLTLSVLYGAGISMVKRGVSYFSDFEKAFDTVRRTDGHTRFIRQLLLLSKNKTHPCTFAILYSDETKESVLPLLQKRSMWRQVELL